jgi:Ca-activated chloride channel family protein
MEEPTTKERVMKNDRRSMTRFLGLVGALALVTLVVGVLADAGGVATAVAGNRSGAGFAAQDGVVRLSGHLDRAAVLAAGDGEVKLELVLEAIAAGRRVAVPTDFVVVLDRSGSMGGEKIARARDAVAEILQQLTPRDRFGLIAYSSGATVQIPLSEATPVARASWARSVAAIEASGGTNMSGGIDLGLGLLDGAAAGRARRVILISDGLANEGDSSFEGLVARATRAARSEAVLSTVGVGLDFNEHLMSALADRGTGNFYFLSEGVQLAEVFAQEFAATRETVVSSTEVSLETAAGVRVVDAAGYPLETAGEQTVFRPGALYAGQERRIWVTFAVPTEPGVHDVGAVRLSYQRDGRSFSLASARPVSVQAVVERERFLDGVDEDRWARSVVEEDFGRLQEKVATYVREGDREQAKRELAAYRMRTSTLNRELAVPAVTSNLGEVDRLEERVDDAFEGADQALKQNELSKESQAKAWDQRRLGAKRTAPVSQK